MTILRLQYECVDLIWEVWQELGKIHMPLRNMKIKLFFWYADIWHDVVIFARGKNVARGFL